jgi:hypothetical protein
VESKDPEKIVQDYLTNSLIFDCVPPNKLESREDLKSPYNPMNNQMWPITDPDQLTVPSYEEGVPA